MRILVPLRIHPARVPAAFDACCKHRRKHPPEQASTVLPWEREPAACNYRSKGPITLALSAPRDRYRNSQGEAFMKKRGQRSVPDFSTKRKPAAKGEGPALKSELRPPPRTPTVKPQGSAKSARRGG